MRKTHKNKRKNEKKRAMRDYFKLGVDEKNILCYYNEALEKVTNEKFYGGNKNVNIYA